MYRLRPATFPRCQNGAKDATGVTFTTPGDDEVNESGISAIGNGINECNKPSNTNDNTFNIDHNDDDDDEDDLSEEDDILDEEGDDTTKSSTNKNRGRHVG